MHPFIRIPLFAATSVMAVSDLYAQSRGGVCRGGLCALTGTAIFIVFVGLFVASVYSNIKRKGLVKGVIGHTGIRILVGYLAMLLVIIGVPVLLDLYFGKAAAIWGLGGMSVTCFVANSWLFNRPSGSSNENNTESRKQA